MNGEKQRADLGFEDEFENLNLSDWTPEQSANDRAKVDSVAVRTAAEKEGFTSREPQPAKPPKARPTKPSNKPKKAPTDQLNIRTKVSAIDEFKALCDAQEPKWPLGYAFERALAALKREVGKG